jgi:D-sedoheptulose 7-phosphate isomerase
MHSRLKELLERYPVLTGCASDITATHEVLTNIFRAGNKLLIAGNGGSAADSDHISGELLKGFCSKRPLAADWDGLIGSDLARGLQGALPAIPLPDLTGLVSAFCNDCNPEHVFAQLVLGLGQKGDALLSLSTSGNSKNLLHAIKVAKAKGMHTIGLGNETGGAMKSMLDICICVPAMGNYKVQEYHLPIYHTLCLMLEDTFFGSSA